MEEVVGEAGAKAQSPDASIRAEDQREGGVQDGAINQSGSFCGMPVNVPRWPSETGILA